MSLSVQKIDRCILKHTFAYLLLISSLFSQDSLRLVNFYNATSGPDWIENNNWLSDKPISEWYGITVKDSAIIAIELQRNNLIGELPEIIGNFQHLEKLNLSDNNLVGDIPIELNKLVELRNLDLSHNQLNSLPNEILGSLEDLIILNLSNNILDGNIPRDIGKSINLNSIDLSNNKLGGNIPLELFRLQKLTKLNLQNNKLVGIIPRQIGNCKNIEYLDLSRNNLSGIIPKEIGKLQNLKERLALDHNKLNGLIPKEISLLSNLEHIWLNNNSFTGILPFELGKMKSLKSLFIYQNRLVGPLPLTLGNLRDLEVFYAQNNSFGGEVPQEIWFLPKLKMLKLENNQLTGTIPGDLKILRSIQSINLSNNRFKAIITPISLPTSLLFIDLSHNSLFCVNGEETQILDDSLFQKLIGIETQNCEDNSWNSFTINENAIDFKNVKTDSTAQKKIMISSNNSRKNILRLQHFDKNNFYISDSLLDVVQDDTVFIDISYSPIEAANHYDVLIINDIIENKNQFISIVGKGLDINLPERDTSIPWTFKLHSPEFSEIDTSFIIKYDIPETSNADIAIYNLGGVPVKQVHKGSIDAGFYNYIWDGKDEEDKLVEGGEYLCVMQAGMFIQIQQILFYK